MKKNNILQKNVRKSKNIRPLGKNILLNVKEGKQEDQIAGIIIPKEFQKNKNMMGVVCAIGPKVQVVKVGQTVLFYRHHFEAYDAKKIHLLYEEIGEPKGLLISEADLLMIVE